MGTRAKPERAPLAPLLRALGACADPGEAVPWAESRLVDAAAWAVCTRPDWMVWLLFMLGARGSPLWQGALLCCADFVRQAHLA